MKSNSSIGIFCRNLLVLILVLSFQVVPSNARQATAPKPDPTLSAEEREAASKLSADTIRTITSDLAKPEMQGRGTGQPGGEKAAKYLADYFAKLGLEPLGDKNSFLQAIQFTGTTISQDSTLKAGNTALKYGEDYVVAPPLSDAQIDLKGGLVFVGYGVVSPELKRDDLANLDLKGKTVVMLSGMPKNVDAAAWQKAANPQMILGNLMSKGAAAFIITNVASAQRPFSELTKYLTRRQVSVANAIRPTIPPRLIVSDAGAEKLFAGSVNTYAQTKQKAEAGETVSRDLSQELTGSIKVKNDEGQGSNVVGLMQGSDPDMKDQAVVYTAHYDAFGIDQAGRIFPGAADNALGVGELAAIAEAFARLAKKPRRSIIFLAVTGEEYGLYGSEHWVHNPTWPLSRVAADLNFDGIGTETYGRVKQIVGFGGEYSDLGKTLDAVATAEGDKIIPDPVPDEQVFYRSDHFSFVKQGVPSLMLLGGPEGDTAAWIARAKKWLDSDYHNPTDIVRPDWNWAGAKDIADIGLILGMRVANADTAPSWLPTSPFKRP